MSSLTVTVLDVSGEPAEDVEVVARLTDMAGRRIVAYTIEGHLLIEPVRGVTDGTGTTILDLVPQDEVDRANTYYTVYIGRTPGGMSTEKLILKTNASQLIGEAEVFEPEDLGPAAGLRNLRDVDITGITMGQVLRWDGLKLVPYSIPAGGAGSDQRPYRLFTGSFPITLSDAIVDADATGGALTLTLPTAVAIAGKSFDVKRINPGPSTVTVQPMGSEKIDGLSQWVFTMAGEAYTFTSTGTDWRVS